jgi:ribosomal protein S18
VTLLKKTKKENFKKQKINKTKEECIMKELLIIFIATQVIILLMKGTFLGRCVFMSFRITKGMIKMNYKALCIIYKFINKGYKSYNRRNTKKNSNHQSKKVVNGNNIIEFKSAKQLRHKWHQ